MGKINYRRMVRALDDLEKIELIHLRDEIDKRLGNKQSLAIITGNNRRSGLAEVYTMDTVQQWLDRYRQMRDLVETLATTLTLVDSFASQNAITRDKDSIRLMCRGLDGELSRQLTGLIGFLRDNSFSVDTGSMKEIRHMVVGRIEALQRFLTGEDNGEYLRQTIQDSGSRRFREIINQRVEVNFGGRQKGRKPHTLFIQRRAKVLKEENPNWSTGDIANRIVWEGQAKEQSGRLFLPGEEEALRVLIRSPDAAGIVRKALNRT